MCTNYTWQAFLNRKYFKFIKLIFYPPQNIRSDITKDKFVLDMTAYVPLITIDGSFKGKGSFNMMSLNTKVSFNATLSKF